MLSDGILGGREPLQKLLREEMVYFSLHFQMTVHHSGKSEQELMQKPWRDAARWPTHTLC